MSCRCTGAACSHASARGTFPLAIFAGQVTAALAAGNAVVAKPAEPTPLIAARFVTLLHEAGVPPEALQLTPAPGACSERPLSRIRRSPASR